MIGQITPIELRSKLTEVDMANGFGNRIIWLTVRRQRTIYSPQPVGPMVPTLAGRLSLAMKRAQEQSIMEWTPEALDVWKRFYDERNALPQHGLTATLTARAEAQVVRLSLIYALADGADAVGMEHLQAALAFWRYAEDSVRNIFGDSTGNRHADALRELLHTSNGEVEWKTARDELNIRDAGALMEAVRLLETLKIASLYDVPREGGGRARRVIRSWTV
jgi:hypothetical protein